MKYQNEHKASYWYTVLITTALISEKPSIFDPARTRRSLLNAVSIKEGTSIKLH